MQLYSVLVRLGGDIRNAITPANRGFGHGVVSWPEVQVLRAAHGGDETVVLLADAGRTAADVSPRAEKNRLLAFGYPRQVVERLFPGASPRMDMDPPLDEPGLPQPATPAAAAAAAPEPEAAPAQARRAKPPTAEAA